MNTILFIQIFKTFYPFFIVILLYIFQYISFTSILFVYLIYCIYVYYNTKTTLSYSKSHFNINLINHCPEIKNANFKQYFLFPFTIAQFYLLSKTTNKPKQKIIYTNQKTDEFGTELVWLKYEHKKDPHSFPVFLILPGITGKAGDSYIHNLSVKALDNNYDVVVFQMRALSAEMKMGNSNHFNLLDDFENALKFIKKINKNKIYAIGCSFGANTLVTYLGTKNLINKDINYGISFSNSYDMYLSQRIGEGTLYESLILYFSKKNYIDAIKSINKEKKNYFDVNKMLNTNAIKDFDKMYIGKLLGFETGDDYYKGASCGKFLIKVNVPLLMIHSKDDPITTYKGIPFDDIEKNENLILISTDKGGHLCFIENVNGLKTSQWVCRPVFDFCNYFKNLELKNQSTEFN